MSTDLRDEMCPTCKLGLDGHVSWITATWHGAPCHCGCPGAWADVPEAWLPGAQPEAS